MPPRCSPSRWPRTPTASPSTTHRSSTTGSRGTATPFVTQGYIYEAGTLADGGGVNPDGSPTHPEAVIGTWICEGVLIGDGAYTTTGPWVVSTQVFDFGEFDGLATVVSHGIEVPDIGKEVQRAMIGGTGEHVGAVGKDARCSNRSTTPKASTSRSRSSRWKADDVTFEDARHPTAETSRHGGRLRHQCDDLAPWMARTPPGSRSNDPEWQQFHGPEPCVSTASRPRRRRSSTSASIPRPAGPVIRRNQVLGRQRRQHRHLGLQDQRSITFAQPPA